jgi:hypothetical protein
MATAVGKIRYDVVAKTAQFTTEMQKVNSKLTGMTKSLKSMGGILAGAFAVDRIFSFTTELINLNNQVRGVEKAFNALNPPGLLKNLQEATGGAVDNLTLMQKAVQAKNFNIPLERLGTLLKFAAIRAAETGENVDYLVNSIITGLGRKSVMILDNLGISATDIRDKMKDTGDFAQAVADIVDRELGNSTVTIDEASTSVGKLQAAWKNLKIEMSEGTGPLDILLNSIAETMQDFADTLNDDTIPPVLQEDRYKVFKTVKTDVKEANDEVGELINKMNWIATGKGMQAIFQPKKTPIKGIKGTAVFGGFDSTINKPFNEIGAMIEAEQYREINEVAFDFEKALEEIKLEMADVVEVTEEWQEAMWGVDGILGGLNEALRIVGVRLQIITKTLMFLRTSFNLFRLISGFGAPKIASDVGRGIVTPGMPNPLLGKLRGADIVGATDFTNGIRLGLGVN